ncbi:hypothetical protein [Microbacterium aurantiacum]|uniref:hypothetical protein n=1 Tax=Microbacterium aurantiacum TaxID=162393 RepID=UPI000C7FE640|nr:hypothetical protein [Microbacterium aurantiacum]
MYSFAIAGAGSSEALWAWIAARREIESATAALDVAVAGLQTLAEDSDWQSDGVRALHALLSDLRSRASAELASLFERERELERIGAA